MEADSQRPAWKTLLAFAIIYFVWGSTFLAIRVGVREVPPFLLAAMRFLWERLKIVVEPSAAVPLAAMLEHAEAFAGQRVGVILSGGNVDLDRLPWMAA